MLDIERAVLQALADPASAGDPEADHTGLDPATAPEVPKDPGFPPPFVTYVTCHLVRACENARGSGRGRLRGESAEIRPG